MMIELLSMDDLTNASIAKKVYKGKNVLEKLTGLSQIVVDRIGLFTIVNQGLVSESMLNLFSKSNFPFPSDDELKDWLIYCIGRGLIKIENEENGPVIFSPEDDAQEYFEKTLPEQTKEEYSAYADEFYIDLLTAAAQTSNVELPDDTKTKRALLIGPNGLLDTLIHNPQERSLHSSALGIAINWQNHLFRIHSYDEAANIVNMSCFSLAREGYRDAAKNLLIRVISVTTGVTNAVSKVNLATLLREEYNLNAAIVIYRNSLWSLIRARAFQQMITVISEMGSLYRQQGRYAQAILFLELGSLLHGLFKNPKSQGIARSQLASVYRSIRLYGLALRSSKLAINAFRVSVDSLNLGRSLLTQGNILYNLRNAPAAMKCFDEALEIGKLNADPQAICGALAGKARVYMLSNNFDEAKPLLDEAIALRQRNSDHSVGIEYQNLGYFYELKGNLALALTWYKKALKIFEMYMPGEVAACQAKIRAIEK